MGHDSKIMNYLFLKHFTLTLHTSWPPVQSWHKTSTSPSPKPAMTSRLVRHWLRCSVRSALYRELSSRFTYRLSLLLRSSPGTSGTSAPPTQAMCKKLRSAPYKLARSCCEAIPKQTSKCHYLQYQNQLWVVAVAHYWFSRVECACDWLCVSHLHTSTFITQHTVRWSHSVNWKLLYNWLSYTTLTEFWTLRMSCAVKHNFNLFFKLFFMPNKIHIKVNK
jgi:hypothetical protein